MQPAEVSIVIVNYNGAKFLPKLIESIKNQTFKNFELIIVDNSSKDNSLSFLKTQKGIIVVESKENLGFAGGCNLGIKYARGKYIALLNNDVIVHKKWLEELVKAIKKDNKRGAVVSKIYIYNKNSKEKILDSAGSIYNNIGTCLSRGFLEIDNGQYDTEEEVPMGTACSLLFKREILGKTYLFDDDYFMYIEEMDFNIRVRKLGYSIWYIPYSIVYHRLSQAVFSEIKNKTNKKAVVFKQKYASPNRLNVILKHYPLKIILKNFHLIFLSFLYWDIYILLFGSLKDFIELKKRQIYMAYKGLKERRDWVKHNDKWLKFMEKHSLKDLLKMVSYIRNKRKKLDKVNHAK